MRSNSFEPYYPESKIDFVKITQDVIRELTGFEVNNEDMLNMPHIEYFKNLNNVLTKIPPNDLEHYLTFRELINMVSKTTTRMTDIFNQWSKIVGGPDVPNPRQVIKPFINLCIKFNSSYTTILILRSH